MVSSFHQAPILLLSVLLCMGLKTFTSCRLQDARDFSGDAPGWRQEVKNSARQRLTSVEDFNILYLWFIPLIYISSTPGLGSEPVVGTNAVVSAALNAL